MSHKHKPPPQEEESGEGAPLWIISFADMISLLMAFFVMLSTFSGFGPSEAEQLHRAVRATLAPNYYGGWYARDPRPGAGAQSVAAGQPDRGSEKPTLDETQGNGLMKETNVGDFRTRKVFVVESKTVFWGAGTALSPTGHEFLDTLAAYAGTVPDRMVITESGPGDNPELGLLRAIVTVNYLTTQGIAKERCSVAAEGTLPAQSSGKERTLEIALLDESVYK